MKKIHKDKKGLDYIKESYFVAGKMKYRKLYLIDGMPAEEFYEKNATDINHFINEEYWLMSSEQNSNDNCQEKKEPKPNLPNDEIEDFSF